jgi:adhesin transport system outer membrane protein
MPGMPGGTIVKVEDTIQATLRTHRSLKAIQENREAVEHELDRAEAFYGPRLDVTGGVGIGKLSNSTSRSRDLDGRFYPTTNVSATLTQPLYDGFANRGRVRNARATLDSMTHRVFDNATTLALDSIIGHIDVLRQREIVRLAEENVTRHEETLVQARDREILGADTMADVTQAESRLARALSTLVESRTALLNSEENYRRLTGMSPSYDLVPVDTPSRLYSGTSEVMEDAKRFNPKLAAYIKDVMAARGSKELAAAAFHPAINFEMGPRYSDRDSTGDEWTYSFDVMTTMRWNVLNSGADLAASRAAESRVRQARQFMYNYVDDMALEIETTWNSYTSSQDQYKHYMDAIQFNTTTRDAYQEQFLIGQRSLLDVLDADSELFSSSTQAITARGNVLISSYRLLALAGVLLPSMNIDTANLYTAPEEAPMEPRERF